MSPIPISTPLRRTIARAMFSPAGLLLGFVVLLMATCPGARGENGTGLVSADNAVLATGKGLVDLGVQPPAEAPRQRVIGRSTRFRSTGPSSPARSPTPTERDARANELFRHSHSQSALPMLTDPLLTDAPRVPAAAIRPMTGPTVGIGSKFPRE